MKRLFLTFQILLICFSACNNKDPIPEPPAIMPQATQNGANTFGCLINGVIYSCSGQYTPAVVTNGIYSGPKEYCRIKHTPWDYNDAKIIAVNYPKSFSFEIRVAYYEGADTLEMVDANFGLMIGNEPTNYKVLNSKPAYLVLSKNEKYIKSGYADFWIVNEKNPNDIKHVSQLRFDVQDY